MGKPILIGEYTFNFADAAANAIENNAAIRVNSVEDLRAQIQLLLQDTSKREQMGKAAISYSQAATGATQKMLIIIAPYLSVKASLVDY